MRARAEKAVAQEATAAWSMTGKTVLFTEASRGIGHFAAIELARRWHTPVEWFAISAGAKIAMDSCT